MKVILVALAAGAIAACSPGAVKVDSKDEGATVSVRAGPQRAAGPYAMEVFAANDAQIYLVTGPEGKAAAARAAGGQSASMPVAEAQTLLAKLAPAAAVETEGGDKVSINLPFVNLKVQEGANGPGQANVSIEAGGNKIEVNAKDSEDLAHVRVTGADADAARDFINEAEKLTPATKAEMKAALGL